MMRSFSQQGAHVERKLIFMPSDLTLVQSNPLINVRFVNDVAESIASNMQSLAILERRREWEPRAWKHDRQRQTEVCAEITRELHTTRTALHQIFLHDINCDNDGYPLTLMPSDVHKHRNVYPDIYSREDAFRSTRHHSTALLIKWMAQFERELDGYECFNLSDAEGRVAMMKDTQKRILDIKVTLTEALTGMGEC